MGKELADPDSPVQHDIAAVSRLAVPEDHRAFGKGLFSPEGQDLLQLPLGQVFKEVEL
jgi:hypothetical protein